LANKVEGGTVRLRTWLEGTRLNILIEDDGVGIDEEKLEALFESGIGVSNVNERLRVLFGGGYRIAVDSKPGEGTKTLIEIPELEDVDAASSPVAVSRG
jgi:sensor histidine kinase YesM